MLNEIRELLMQTGYPVAYNHFSEAPTVPFITYMEVRSNNFSADDVVYSAINGVQVELYSDEKDREAESKVENALRPFVWEKYETYIDTEHLYQIIYEFEV